LGGRFLLALSLWLNTGDTLAGPPEFPAPPDARVSWIARSMVYQGLPMQIRAFQTRDAIEDVVDFYREEWDDADDGGNGYIINKAAEPWVVISRIEEGFLMTVQVQATGKDRAWGYLARSRLPTDDHDDPATVKRGKTFPQMGDTAILSEMFSEDPGKKARTMMLKNNFDIRSNVSFYRNHYGDSGWAFDIDRAVGDRMHVFAVRKGRRLVNMVIMAGTGDDTGSRIVANEVVNELL
jgi:hypothetical protein